MLGLFFFRTHLQIRDLSFVSPQVFDCFPELLGIAYPETFEIASWVV